MSLTEERRHSEKAPFVERRSTAPAAAIVPSWLAALVLVLLLAVFAVGGYLVRARNDSIRAGEPGAISVGLAQKRMEASPEDPTSRLQLGFEYQKAGRYEEALREYERVLESSPRNTAALYNKAMLLKQQGDVPEAEKIFWDVLEIEPTHAMAAKALGEVYADKGQYKSLLIAVKPAIKANPAMADLHYLAAIAYENLDQRPEAAAEYQAALRYNPDLADARTGLARLGVE